MVSSILPKHFRCKELDGDHANGCSEGEAHVENSSPGECVHEVSGVFCDACSVVSCRNTGRSFGTFFT